MQIVYVIIKEHWYRNGRTSWRHGSIYSCDKTWKQHITNPLVPGRALCGFRWDHWFKTHKYDKPESDTVLECKHCKIAALKQIK